MCSLTFHVYAAHLAMAQRNLLTLDCTAGVQRHAKFAWFPSPDAPGIPCCNYLRLQVMSAYWGIGLHSGVAIPQNQKGHLVGHVKVRVVGTMPGLSVHAIIDLGGIFFLGTDHGKCIN
jgi:hypothetical protein